MSNTRRRSSFLGRACTIAIMTLFCAILFSQNSPVVSSAEEDDKPVPYLVVSLGDSYASGEGVEPFYDQYLPVEQKVKSEDWLAHRSMNSWSGKLTLPYLEKPLSEYKYNKKANKENNQNNYWYFEANSGATTAEILGGESVDWNDTALVKEYYIFDGNPEYSYVINSHKKKDITGIGHIDEQIKIFEKIKEEKGYGTVRYVTVTIGGNDAEFSKAMKMVMLNSKYHNPNELRDFAMDFYRNKISIILANLTTTYAAIQDAAGPQATIIVAGYPRMFNEKGGSTSVYGEKGLKIYPIGCSEDEAKIINEAADYFNEKIESLVNDLREKQGLDIWFVDVNEDLENQVFNDSDGGVYRSFRGHEIFTDDYYINPLYYHYVDLNREDYDQREYYSRYSFHPNLKGIEVYRKCVQDMIDEREKDKPYGLCGDSLTYSLSEDGVLTVSGSGKMWDYERGSFGSTAPWFNFKNRIREVVVKGDVISIGSFAFAGCSELTDVTIPGGVLRIADSAFRGCESLKHVYYSSVESDWNRISISDGNEPLTNANLHCITIKPDDGEEQSEKLFAVDGYVLDRGYDVKEDKKYEYSYYDNGLCSGAVSNENEIINFTYEYNSEGRPVARYGEIDGEKQLIETYYYDDNGTLQYLVSYEDGEIGGIWIYDQDGRASRGVVPVELPYPPEFPGAFVQDIRWYENGKLQSISFPESYPINELVQQYCLNHRLSLSENQFYKIADPIVLYINDRLMEEEALFRDSDGSGVTVGYTIAEVQYDFEYDTEGRLVKLTQTEEKSPLSQILEDAQLDISDLYALSTLKEIHEVRIEYSDDIIISDAWYNFQNDELIRERVYNKSAYHVIEYNSSGLPVSVDGYSTDVYDSLDCTVQSAEVGYYGIWWNDTMTDIYGELHGGFAGYDIWRNGHSNDIPTLKVSGRDRNNSHVEYYIYPNSLGRQQCQKFTNEMLSMQSQIYCDPLSDTRYVMEKDENQLIYKPVS